VTCLPKDRRTLLEPEHPNLSLRRQCELLEVNRSSIYYKEKSEILTPQRLAFLRVVDEIYTRYPFFGTRQMADYLNKQSYEDIKRHHTRWAYEKLGLQSVAPGPQTSQPHPEHKVYPYLLRGVKITAVNQVWSDLPPF